MTFTLLYNRFIVIFFVLVIPVSTAKLVRFGSKSIPDDHPHANLLIPGHRYLHSPAHEVVNAKQILLPSARPDNTKGFQLEFELFNGEVALGVVTSFTSRGENITSWTGTLRVSSGNLANDLKVDDGFSTLSCAGLACTANLHIASTDSEYAITPAGTPLTEEGEGVYELCQIVVPLEKKSKAVPPPNPKHSNMQMAGNANGMLLGNALQAQIETTTAAAAVDQDLIYDLLVMYTREALAQYGGR